MEKLCIITQDVHCSSKGVGVSGKIYSGTLNVGDKLVLPEGSGVVLTRCRGIVYEKTKTFTAQATVGDNVIVILPANVIFSAANLPFIWGENTPRHSKLRISVNADAEQQKELSEKLKKLNLGKVLFPDFGKELYGAGKVIGFFEKHCEVLIELLYPLWIFPNQIVELSKDGEKLLQGTIVELL